jgi:hypothetical protein
VIKFKQERQVREFEEIYPINPSLHKLLWKIADFVQEKYKKHITITSVHRTTEEHVRLYKQVAPKLRPKSSPHMEWEAIDIRTSDLNDEIINDVVKTLGSSIGYKNSSGLLRPTIVYHKIPGNAYHFHIQVNKPIKKTDTVKNSVSSTTDSKETYGPSLELLNASNALDNKADSS